ncbi:probable serine/threonine-protein kinase DDB_G0282963 [Penaeus japonicus]|uniref:probable serine/threonine-protein kinase DDB_G0282963 n=1 Tax=Penaeus japonicus TaxID=27405 RepID=UPI001C70F172|nr:probable serine/threonine-protein kinase DDB_G0282963 [Penaeus japonicus]
MLAATATSSRLVQSNRAPSTRTPPNRTEEIDSSRIQTFSLATASSDQTFGNQRNSASTFSTFNNQQNLDSQFQQGSSDNFQSSLNQQNSNNRLQSSFDNQNSNNRFQSSFNNQNSNNRFQSSFNNQNSNRFQLGFNNQNNNQQNFNNRFQSSQQNSNNRISQNSQSQTSALFRSGSTFDSSSDSVNGAFEPLNLPSGASFLLGSISSSFNCLDRPYGYYADQENSCRIFHICNPALFSNGAVETYQYSFMCGEGTVFDQKELACVTESSAIPCQESSNFFYTNEQFGRPEDKAV